LSKRLKLWRHQEWHDWFRWRLCLAGFDWSKLIWLGALGIGFVVLLAYGSVTARWSLTAGGIVAWFTVINLGGFVYMGLLPRRPPLPVPGPFEPGRNVRVRLGLYPPAYDGRKLARIWLRMPVYDETVQSTGGTEKEWLFELTCPAGLPQEFEDLVKQQYPFRLHRGDAPSMQAVCETRVVSRAEIDSGTHPLKLLAWRWDEQSAVLFGRPRY